MRASFQLFSRDILLLLCMTILLFGCEREDAKPTGNYANGVIIVNEGGFGSANGTLSFYRVNDSSVEQNIFRNEQGNFAGDVVQSMTLHGEKGYIVANGDNKVEIINSNTLERLATITNTALDKPRYMEVMNNKAYISVWGPYAEGGYSLVDSYVLVVDLMTNEVVKKIETDEGTEQLLQAGKYLFVSNYNYGASSTVAVIDPANNTLIDQLEVGSGPAGLVTDANEKVWVICTGDFGSSNGTLVRINPSTLVVEKRIDLGVNPDVDLALTPDNSSLIYTAGSNVYKLSITSTAAPLAPYFIAADVVSNYALGIDPATGDIWIGDAINFVSAGKVYIYDASGSRRTSFTTGIGPTQFVFK